MAAAASFYRRAATIAATMLVSAGVLSASQASAEVGPALSLACPSSLEHPFLRWLDPAAYTLAPGGAFEGAGSSWQLSRGAALVLGNEPFKVHSSKDARSLSIPAGGSAVSPSFCVGLGEPTLRFFATGKTLSLLRVDVLYRTVLGDASQTVTLVPGTGRWLPTLPAPMLGNLLGLTSLDGLTTTVRLRFTPLGGDWRIDDVYVDPWKVR